MVLSGGRGRTSLDQMASALRSQVPWPVNFSIVDLENPRFDEDSFRKNLAEALHSAYPEKPDLVLACMDPALKFATEYHDSMFAGTPVVFMSVSSGMAERANSPLITGVAEVPGIRDTIDLALRLHPDTKAVAIVSGESETEKSYLAATHAELLRRAGRVEEIDLVGPPSGQMLEKIAGLPAETVVLFQLFPHDSEELAIGAYDVLTEASQRLPTYSIFPSLALDHGGIGGAYTNASQDAVLAGQMAARILSGETPAKMPVVNISDFQIRVDWRQLQRWHIPESALPPGTLVLNRPPGVWQLYKRYIVGAVSLMLLEAFLIVTLLWERARRRRTERELEMTYDRLALSVTAGISVGWDADFKTGKNRWLGDLQTVFGIQDGHHTTEFGEFAKRVHPDDRKWVEAAMEEARMNREPYAAEFRVVRNDGSVRWISSRGKFYYAAAGEPERMLGMATDITDRKAAEEAVNSLSGKLIRAQEDERQRIAREIHDDHQQRIAVLAIELATLSQELEEVDPDASFRLNELCDRATELGTDLHSLSHRLHSSTLDNMGLVAALKVLCREFRNYHDLRVTLVAERVPDKIPSDVALCLFRVTQEALQNVKKHSGAERAEVRVETLEDKIRLSISDDGMGFNPRKHAGRRGIGLHSMEERLRLVNGHFEIRSRPMGGTVIEAWVPIVLWAESGMDAEDGDASGPPEHMTA